MKYKVKEDQAPEVKPVPKQDSPNKPKYQEKIVENKPVEIKEEKKIESKEKNDENIVEQ